MEARTRQTTKEGGLSQDVDVDIHIYIYIHAHTYLSIWRLFHLHVRLGEHASYVGPGKGVFDPLIAEALAFCGADAACPSPSAFSWTDGASDVREGISLRTGIVEDIECTFLDYVEV